MKYVKFLLAPFLLACFFIVSIVYYGSVKEDVTRETMQYMDAIIQQSKQTMYRSVNDVFRVIQTTAVALERADLSDMDAVRALLNDVAQVNGFKRMGIIFPDGRTETSDNAKVSLADREYAQRALSGEVNISTALSERIGSGGGTHINVYAAPLMQDGDIHAALFATYDTNYLGNMLSTSLFSRQSYAYLVRADGMLVSAQRGEAFARYENMIYTMAADVRRFQTLMEHLRNNRNDVMPFRIDDKAFYATFTSIDTHHLFMLAVIPEEAIETQVAKRMSSTGLFILGLAILTLALLAYIRLLINDAKKERLQARIEAAASQTKSAFLSAMSHEIRTPLNAIVGFLHLLGKSALQPEQQTYLRKARIASGTLLQLVNDILDYIKIEGNVLDLEKVHFHLDSLLDALNSIVTDTATEKGLSLHFYVHDDVPKVLSGDRARLSQILLNLLNNALQHTKQGEITVEVTLVRRQDTLVRLGFRVTDTGAGIAPERLTSLFEPFVQSEEGHGRRFKENGLGLTMCRHLVRLMGGTIEATSEPGKGSSFYFTVEMVEAHEAAHLITPPSASVSPSPTPDAASSAAPELDAWPDTRVLIVEDNEINQEIIAELLRSFGLDSDLAANGSEALDMAARKSYPLILMDIQMPVMDGVEATYRLRALAKQPNSPAPWLASTPIVALTANVTMEDRQRCMDAGMDDFLTKPINVEVLLCTLRLWLGTDKHAHRARENSANVS